MHEALFLFNGIKALVKETSGSIQLTCLSFLLLSEDIAFSPSKDARARCYLGTREQPLVDIESAGILILDFPQKCEEQNSIFYTLCSLQYFVTATQTKMMRK